MFSMRAVHWNEGGLKVGSRCLTLVCFTFKTSMRAVHWSEGSLKVDSRRLTLVCFTFNVQHEGCALE